MSQICHLPYGMDDPYLNNFSIQRIPKDPAADEQVQVNFQTFPMQAGQRAWIIFSVNGMPQVKTRARFDYAQNGWALWTCCLGRFKKGDTVRYRIFSGLGDTNAVSSDEFEFCVKAWENCGTFESDLLKSSKRFLSCLTFTDGKNNFSRRYFFKRQNQEKFFGMGEHYDSIELGDRSYTAHVFDQYKVQGERGYAPVPFIFSENGFGVFADTGYRTSFFLNEDTIEVFIDTLGQKYAGGDITIWEKESPQQVISEIYKLSNPVVPPLWVFGPWISANEWNNQNMVENALRSTLNYNLPCTVIVIEAWSDEQGFYKFNGAQNMPVAGKMNFKDFSFNHPWPDPYSMIKNFHEHGIKVILWQIPVFKMVNDPDEQHRKDLEYALQKKFFVMKKDGTPYEIPTGRWFEGSYVVDLFNPQAREWFKEKRKYLIDELEIDGFKTDGGEHLWGRDTFVYEGISVAQARNLFTEKYFETEKEVVGEDKVLFSRAGYTRSPSSTLFWVGDEDSDIEALKSNIIAGLNVSLCGNPFWGWDIAGFSGELPDPELYRRSLEIAVFTPIFQIHSECNMGPYKSAERTPWNMAEVFSDCSLIDYYRKIASLRMSLIPYIAEQAEKSVTQQKPLTMPYNYTINYFFGEDIFIAPDLEGNGLLTFDLPSGQWINLWEGKEYSGGRSFRYECKNHYSAVFIRKGAMLSINLPESRKIYEPGKGLEKNALLIGDFYEKKNHVIQNLKSAQTEDISFIGFFEESQEDGFIAKIKWIRIEEVNNE